MPTEHQPVPADVHRPENGRALRRALHLLFAAAFIASFDRLIITPLLFPMARDLDVPVEQIAAVATVYFVGYGLMQVVWGFVSDRIGRVRTMRVALTLAALAGLATILAPGVLVLGVARFVAGAAFAAVFPGTIIYIGDSLPPDRRHGPLADLMAVSALGMAAATVVTAALNDLAGWRVALAVPTVVATVVVVLVARVPEPEATHARQRPGAALAAVLLRPWPVAVLVLVLVEGMLLLGVLTYLPALLQRAGMGTTLSGLVTAGYGLAVMVATPLVKRLGRGGMSPARMLAWGGVLSTGAYVALLADRDWPGVLVACVLLAGAWAYMHPTLQTWVTEVAPEVRATAVSLFASSLFLGSAAWTAIGAAPFAADDLVGYLVVGTALSVALGVAAWWLRRSYRG